MHNKNHSVAEHFIPKSCSCLEKVEYLLQYNNFQQRKKNVSYLQLKIVGKKSLTTFYSHVTINVFVEKLRA